MNNDYAFPEFDNYDNLGNNNSTQTNNMNQNVDSGYQNYGYNNNGFNNNANGTNSYQGGPFYADGPLKTNRNFIIVALLSFITCGLYNFYFIGKLIQDLNQACQGDGKHQDISGLDVFLFGFLTSGIYTTCVTYELVNRIKVNAARYGLVINETGITWLLWNTIGCMACGLGPFIGTHIICKNANAICDAYNRSRGYY